jgi:hypothetical protein
LNRLSRDLTRFVVYAGAAVALAGCGGGNERSAQCPAALRWNAATYFEFPVVDRRHAPKHRASLGSATIPECSDEDPEGGGVGGGPVGIVGLVGVSPQVAVARAEDTNSVYLAEGFLPELREHPLHRAVGGELRPRRCETPISRDGRIMAPRSAVQRTQFRSGTGSPEGLSFRGDAEFRGFRRAGQPYLETGDLIAIRASHCRVRGRPGQRVLVVSSVRPAIGFERR